MTHIGFAVALTGVCSLAAGTLSAQAASTGSPPCTPKVTRIQGHPAVVECGPATVTLHIGGKTYDFRNGFCERSKAAGSALELNLGTTVTGVKDNAGKPEFTMLVAAHLRSAFGSGSVFGADYGGRDLLGGEGLIKVSGNIPANGTFTSTVAAGGKFTGSWNCHGVVWQAP